MRVRSSAGVAVGEQSFLSGGLSKASVKTIDFCELMYLGRDLLEIIMNTDPDLRRSIDIYLAEKRSQYTKNNSEVAEKELRACLRKSTRRRSAGTTNSSSAREASTNLRSSSRLRTPVMRPPSPNSVKQLSPGGASQCQV